MKRPMPDARSDDGESRIMGLSPAQLASKVIGAALIVIVLVVVVSVVSHV